MIYLVSGPPGNGKTFYAIRSATKALESGKVVAGNVDLAQDWPERVSRRNWVHYLRWGARAKFRRRARDCFLYSEDLQQLASIRLHGDREGRGLMILDEAHNWMNARSWSAKDREEIVRLFSQHRKLGWDILLIAQHPDMIDKQVRNLVEYNVYLRNLRKAKWGGVPLFPINLFLAVWCWHSANRVIVKREVFPLSWRRGLYDTNATTHGLAAGDGAEGAVWLPSPPADRRSAAGTADGRTEPAPAGRPAMTGAPPHGGRAPEAHQAAPGAPTDEHAAESGEPEAWPVQADVEAVGLSNSRSSLSGETDG